MKFQTTSKLELNIIKSSMHPNAVSDFAIRNRVPVIVASPEHVGALVQLRAVKNGQYRIICAVDFPAGRGFAMEKLKGLNEDFQLADGYEILLSPDRTEVESRNEMKALHGFLKQINPLVEIRWCLAAHSRPEENSLGILKSMQQAAPSYMRIEPHVKLPNVGVDEHKAFVAKAKEQVPYAIKISGNVDLDLIRSFAEDRQVKRFDVDIDQAVALVKALEDEEREARDEVAAASKQG